MASAVTILKGVYVHPDQLTIGNSNSENNFLTWAKAKGFNMLNLYARSYLYTESKRTQLAAFVSKAKTNYGMILVTVDARFTNSNEEPGWKAYFDKYAKTISVIEPLTEFEPWVKNSAGIYDYPGFFNLLNKMGGICKQHGVKFNFYEGWVGSNYSDPQGAVDEMVKHCDRIFISNYVKVSDYNSTSSSLGKWDNRMDKRCASIAIAVPRVGKTNIDIVEIISLETIAWGASNDFLGTVFACPATSVNKCHSFFGSTWTAAQSAYNQSTGAILQYTNLIGRTFFYSKYAQLAKP